MRSSFARVLKDFMKVPDQKVSVLQGKMVVSQAMASGSIYAHLSLLYLSPYKLVVHQLGSVDKDEESLEQYLCAQ
eukprot:1771317-Amphidinium_carterae.1